MTPDEMKVLARVANRGALNEESPIVVEEESRVSIPEPQNSASLDGLELRVNTLETDVNGLKGPQKELALQTYDVLLNVLKPRKIISGQPLSAGDYNTLDNMFVRPNLSTPAPSISAGSGNIGLYGATILDAAPLNVNYLGFDSSYPLAAKLNSEIKDVVDTIVVGAQYSVEVPIKRSSITNLITVSSLSVKDVSHNILSSSFGTVTRNTQLKIFLSQPLSPDANTCWFDEASNNLKKLDGNGDAVNVLSGTTVGGYTFNSASGAVTLILGASGASTLKIVKIVPKGSTFVRDIPSVQQKDQKIVYSHSGSNSYLYKAENQVGQFSTLEPEISLVRASTAVKEVVLDTTNLRAYLVDNNGLVTSAHVDNLTVCIRYQDKNKTVIGQPLSAASDGLPEHSLIQYPVNTYVYDMFSSSSTHLKLLKQSTSGVNVVADGWYKTSNANIYKIVNGFINYEPFNAASGKAIFEDESSVANPGSVDFTIQHLSPSGLPTDTFAQRAIALTDLAGETYYLFNGKIYKFDDKSLASNLNGLYLTKPSSAGAINGAFMIDANSNFTKFVGYSYNSGDSTYRTHSVDGAGNMTVAAYNSSGLRIDSNDRLVSTNGSGAWLNPAGGLNSPYLFISSGTSFIIRNIEHRNTNSYYAESTGSGLALAGSKFVYGGKLYSVDSFNTPLTLVRNKYFIEYVDGPIQKSGTDGTVSSISNGLFAWPVGDNLVFQQIKLGNQIWVKQPIFDFYDQSVIKYVAVVELLPSNKYGRLFRLRTDGNLEVAPNGKYRISNNQSEYQVIDKFASVPSMGRRAEETPSVSVIRSDLYYSVSADSNAPVVSVLMEQNTGTAQSPNNQVLVINERGYANANITTNPVLVVKPNNSLEYWSGSLRLTDETSSSNAASGQLYNKYYVGYDDKLSRTTLSNQRHEIVSGNKWVKTEDSEYRVYRDGALYTPSPSTVISVAASTFTTPIYLDENGLKMFGKVRDGDTNKWADVGLDVTDFTSDLLKVNNAAAFRTAIGFDAAVTALTPSVNNTTIDGRITTALGSGGILTQHIFSGAANLNSAVEARADARISASINNVNTVGAIGNHIENRVALALTNINNYIETGVVPAGAPNLQTTIDARADNRANARITAALGNGGSLTNHVESGTVDLKAAVNARADDRITGAFGNAGLLTQHVESGASNLRTAIEARANDRIAAAHGNGGSLTNHVENNAADLKTAIEARANAMISASLNTNSSGTIKNAIEQKADINDIADSIDSGACNDAVNRVITTARSTGGLLTNHVESGATNLKTAIEARANDRITAAHGLAGSLTNHVESGAADLKTAVEARADARITAAHGLAGSLTDHVESGAADLKTAVEARADDRITAAHGLAGSLTDHVESGAADLKTAVEARADARITAKLVAGQDIANAIDTGADARITAKLAAGQDIANAIDTGADARITAKLAAGQAIANAIDTGADARITAKLAVGQDIANAISNAVSSAIASLVTNTTYSYDNATNVLTITYPGGVVKTVTLA